jgi:hypothetical protein
MITDNGRFKIEGFNQKGKRLLNCEDPEAVRWMVYSRRTRRYGSTTFDSLERASEYITALAETHKSMGI